MGMKANLLFMSTSAFLQHMLANLLPIPLMDVIANIIFCFPSTFVFRTRSMCWKSSFATRDYTPPSHKKKKTKLFYITQWVTTNNTRVSFKIIDFKPQATKF